MMQITHAFFTWKEQSTIPIRSDAPLRRYLEEVSAHNSPEYTAMSYAWDAETPSEPVYCEDSVLLITSNCEKALRDFKKHPESQIMWIDSICIDQSSVEEWNRQVNLMWTIYWRASRVWVWLGEADEKRLKVLQLFRESVEKSLEHDDWKRAIKSYLLSQFDVHNPLAVRNELMPLFKRTWFPRMWVVQETWPEFRQVPAAYVRSLGP
ncbi:hypothetical protein JMJ35_007052 [Cladonia borealis]|uniref:Heterokaryon incompatibility domain-containing protein n=1 Tax=Cladonia borealis TaxID=184061 RepID=A0AA39QYT9_9LECA|nr:hypothetical protein JMJ35_007052 [Cladonia borealis]